MSRGGSNAIYRDRLPSRAVTVYLYLSDRGGKGNTCFPSVRTIARDTGLSVSTVKRAIDDLEQAGYLEHVHRFRPNGAKSSNLYTLRR